MSRKAIGWLTIAMFFPVSGIAAGCAGDVDNESALDETSGALFVPQHPIGRTTLGGYRTSCNEGDSLGPNDPCAGQQRGVADCKCTIRAGTPLEQTLRTTCAAFRYGTVTQVRTLVNFAPSGSWQSQTCNTASGILNGQVKLTSSVRAD